MKTIIYKSVLYDELGFSINQDSKNEFSVWVDEYESGECGITDWTLIENAGPFAIFDNAYNYIVEIHGEVKLHQTIETTNF